MLYQQFDVYPNANKPTKPILDIGHNHHPPHNLVSVYHMDYVVGSTSVTPKI